MHIEESPAELADEIQLWLRDWEWQSTPPSERTDRTIPMAESERSSSCRLDPPPAGWVTNFLGWSERYDASGRAEAELEVLARAEPDTTNVVTTSRERAAQNAAMRTTLSRVPPELAAQLIEHGYALARPGCTSCRATRSSTCRRDTSSGVLRGWKPQRDTMG